MGTPKTQLESLPCTPSSYLVPFTPKTKEADIFETILEMKEDEDDDRVVPEMDKIVESPRTCEAEDNGNQPKTCKRVKRFLM